MDPHDDRWLLPTRQSDYPARDTVPEAVLHGRREGTFLVLVALFFISTITLPLLGTSRILDLGDALDLDLPFALQIPFGALVFPLGFVATALVCDLFGRRRALALAITGGFGGFALAGLLRASDGDATLVPALALATCVVVAQVVHLIGFDVARRRLRGRQLWLRSITSTLVGQLAGWAAFGLVLYADGGEVDPIIAVATAACLYTCACALVLALPIVIARSALGVYLRIGRYDRRRRRPAPALIIEEAEAAPRARRTSLQPFSSAEMRFFTEGDTLAEAAD